MSRPILQVGVPNAPPGEFFQWVRNSLLSLQADLIDAATVSNMRATALAGAVQVDFTRSDGDSYTLYKNSVPSINGATRIDLGTANVYVDNIGDSGIKRFYVVVAKKGSRDGGISSWVSATTLALGTTVTPPTPPPGTITPFTDDETDSVAIQSSDKGSYNSI